VDVACCEHDLVDDKEKLGSAMEMDGFDLVKCRHNL
jgi:hypothetical protein